MLQAQAAFGGLALTPTLTLTLILTLTLTLTFILTPTLTLTLTRLLLAGVAGVLPLARVPEVAQVLALVLQAWGEQAMGWMVPTLSLLPEAVVGQADKQHLMGGLSGLCCCTRGEGCDGDSG